MNEIKDNELERELLLHRIKRLEYNVQFLLSVVLKMGEEIQDKDPERKYFEIAEDAAIHHLEEGYVFEIPKKEEYYSVDKAVAETLDYIHSRGHQEEVCREIQAEISDRTNINFISIPTKPGEVTKDLTPDHFKG